MTKKIEPVAVITSDIHYNLTTLPLADAALRQAVAKANELEIPLIVAGDLHDTKANLRAECVNAMLNTLEQCNELPFILVGNHDKINEKSSNNALSFLREVACIESQVQCLEGLWRIGYQNDVKALQKYLWTIPEGSTVIMHQGLQGSDSGDYYQDHSALRHEDVAHLRVISGHYHRRQTIDTGKGNTFDYIGNPYTLGFGEANHPEKGFQILMDDGSLEFVPTKLREHRILDLRDNYLEGAPPKPEDLVWVKAPEGYTKGQAALECEISEDFRFEIISEERRSMGELLTSAQTMKQEEVLDNLIASLTNTDDARKERLQDMWKKLVRED